ncbi:hypothetical protein EVC62_14250 [Salinicola endophyticus]|uniref:FimV N-terminal domain-containing protein n=1 Tax=Salinicola endophyticus TaxID=1949083 RepID=A0ABY8FKI3_9GAMM|nr:FimV/HubP family polar landmark protein [Salinicola endophyticus]WFF42565.1 hypothetical protein EVC62_14250 [Salinicola endophyticus]
MRSWVTLFIGGCGLLLATRVQALGVGEPLTVSPLNRPLHVVLPLTESARLEPAQVSVTLADAAAYRRAGLTPDALGDGITARVEKRRGGLAIVLDSDRRVREPFLDLLLKISWPQGQWQREVSLLFDPPDYAATQPLLAAADSTPHSEATAASPSSVSTSAYPTAAAGWPQALTVAPGSTLSTLAASLPPHQGVSLAAAMLALYRANRSAFVAGNIDRLRAGVRLEVPPVATVAALADQAPAALRTLRNAANGADVEGAAARGRAGQVSSASVSGAADSATLARQVAALTQQIQRQQATIAELEDQRERLRAALAAGATPVDKGDVSASDPSGGVSESAVVAALGASAPPGAASTSSPTTSSISTGSTSTAADSSAAGDGIAASGSTPAGPVTSAGDTTPAASTAAAASSTAQATPLDKPTPLPKSASSTPKVSAAKNGSAAALSLWQRAVSWSPLLGALALLGLLWALLRQRRRSREQAQITGHDESSDGHPGAPDEAPRKPRRRAPRGLLKCLKRGVKRRGAQRDPVEVEMGAAAISQADIYIAYGRYAAARDWLEPRLEEDPRHRLSLIRALGELREIEAMEQVLAGFDDSASREQRRTAEALVADYRARYVDESWAVATDHAEAAAADTAAATLLAEDEGALSLARVEDVDALFDAALGGEAAPLPQSPLPDTSSSSAAPSWSDTTPAPEKTPSSESVSTGDATAPHSIDGAEVEDTETPPDAAPTLALEPLPHAFDVAPETLGAGPSATAHRDDAGPDEHRSSGAHARGSEAEEKLEAGEKSETGTQQGEAAAAEPPQERRARPWERDDATAAPLAFPDDPAPQALRIDYQPPTLELDDATPSPTAPLSDASSEIEMPPLDLDARTWRPMGEPVSAETPHQSVGLASPDSASAPSSASGSTAAANTSSENASPGNTSPGHTSSGNASPQHPVSPGDTSLQRGIPVGWEVEEVEFEPPHRDNGRP